MRVHVYNSFQPLPNTKAVVCTNSPCLLVELTFREVCLASKGKHPLKEYVGAGVLEAYCDFYRYASQFDHVGLKDNIYILAEKIDGEWRELLNFTYTYIHFKHFERFSTLELARLLMKAEELCRQTGCLDSYLWEASNAGEVLVFELYYPPLLRRLYSDSVFKTNPWRRLVMAALSDYCLGRVGAFLQQ